jgi:hypothetical protein
MRGPHKLYLCGGCSAELLVAQHLVVCRWGGVSGSTASGDFVTQMGPEATTEEGIPFEQECEWKSVRLYPVRAHS